MVFNNLIKDIENGQYLPIYFLQGEEPFFMDQISNLIQENVLDESEKDFNQTILYGPDTSMDEVLNVSKRYPMMAPYQVVVVKEAQHLIRTIEQLAQYVEHIVPTTILVFSYKNKKLDKRKSLGKILSKKGFLIDCTPIKDYHLNDWIINLGKEKKIKIQPKAAIMLSEFIGNNLSGISAAISKLEVLVDKDRLINVDLVQKNIGFSKDYNGFELQNALAEKNILKANKIIYHFSQNKKNHPLPLTISSLYVFFTKLMKFHFFKGELNDDEMSKKLSIHTFFLKQYNLASNNYSKNKLAKIFGYLREYDLKSKGLGNVSVTDEQLLREMIFKILH